MTMGILAQAPVASLVLYVDNLSKSCEFYERRLGLRVVDRDEIPWCTPPAASHCRSTSPADTASSSPAGTMTAPISCSWSMTSTLCGTLVRRGVEFMRRRTYDVGMVTDFYDRTGTA